MDTGTVRLHRVVKAPPARVYRAFTEGDAMASWIPPRGFLCRVYEFEARPGGRYRMGFTNFGTGSTHTFGGEFIEMVPDARLVYTDRFDDPGMPGEMRTTVVLTAVSCGTDLQITQEGIPAMIPVELCHLGWQESLEKLVQLVEPEIPDGA